MMKNIPANNSTKRRSDIPLIEKSLADLCKLPKKNQIIGRYLFFYENIKLKDARKRCLKLELKELWKKLNFPLVTDGRISTLVSKLIKEYELYRNHGRQYKSSFLSLFDLTKVDGDWLCSEDKKLYNIQLNSQGRIGYTTSKFAAKETIHPSKRRRRSSPIIEREFCISDNSCEEKDDNSSYSEAEDHIKKRNHSSTKIAVQIAIKQKISTRKAANICSSIASSGIDIPTPSQSGVWKRMMV